MPKRRLVLIFFALLLNAVIFSASFTFFNSFNDFSQSYLGTDPNTVVIYHSEASTIFTGTVPSYLGEYLHNIPGVQETSLEVLVQTVSFNGDTITVRGINEDFFQLQELQLVMGNIEELQIGGCFVGERLYERLDLEVNDRLTLQSILRKTIQEVKILGVFRTGTPLDDEVIVESDLARSLRGFSQNEATLIRVKLDQGQLDEETLLGIISKRYVLTFDITSNGESSWRTPLEIKQDGKVIQTSFLSIPGLNQVTLPYGEYEYSIYDNSYELFLDTNRTIELYLPDKLFETRITVFNSTNNLPIPQAEIETVESLTGKTTSYHTDEAGKVNAFLPPGNPTILVRKNGYTKEISLSVSRDLEITVSLGLVPLRIQVWDDRDILSGVTIQVSSENIETQGISDSEGLLELYLPEGLYKVTINREDQSIWKEIQLVKATTLSFHLGSEEQTSDISLNIAWSNETRINNAEISLLGESFQWTGSSDYSGNMVLLDVPNGEYTLRIEKNEISQSTQLSLNEDETLNFILPSPALFIPQEYSPQWIRYLPQSITVKYAGQVFNEATKQIVNIITSTVFVLASLMSIITIVNGIDIIQNMVNETRRSIGILRSIGASKTQTTRIFSIGIISLSFLVGAFGYLLGFGLISFISKQGLLVLSGYTLVPHASYGLLLIAVAQSVLVTTIALIKSLGNVHEFSIMTLLKGLTRKEVLHFSQTSGGPLLAFLVPLIIRAIPEVIIWPLPIGYDTVSAYIPTLIALRTGYEAQVFDFINQRPVFWLIYSLPFPFDGTMFFKSLPVLMHGLLGLSLYYYVEQVSKNRVKALASALLATLYFISLRVSWDLFGNEMGLVLLFVSLTFLEKGVEDTRNASLAFLAVMCTTLTHEAASILLVLSVIPLIYKSIREKRGRFNWLFVVVLPLIFFVIRLRVLDFPLIGSALGSLRYPSSNYSELVESTLLMFAYSVLPIIPFALLGFRSREKYSSMAFMFLGTSIAALSPIFSPTRAITFWTRWAYMSAYPLTLFAVEGLYSLSKYRFRVSETVDVNIGKVTSGFFIFVMLILSIGFLVVPPSVEQPYQKFFQTDSDWIIHHIPSSMQLSTVTPEEATEAIERIQSLNEIVEDDAVLLVDEELRGYAAFYCDKDKVLVLDLGAPWYSNPSYLENLLEKAEDLTSEGKVVYFVGRSFHNEKLEYMIPGKIIQLYTYIQ